MGNDGGSIPTRRELVKSAARTPTVSELKATALESLSHAWAHDALNGEPLDMEAVVSDWRGRLYNYETILKALIPSDGADEEEEAATAPAPTNGEAQELTFAATGIRSLRDVVKLRFKKYMPDSNGRAGGKEFWACPVSLKELGAGTKAVYLASCGHVFAEVAIRQIQEEEDLCPECSEKFERGDVIPILPTDNSEIVRLAARIEDLRTRGLTHSLKKDKSNGKNKKKRKADVVVEQKEKESHEAAEKKSKDKKQKQAFKEDGMAHRLSGINNAMTASLTARVLAEQEERNKRRKLAAAR